MLPKDQKWCEHIHNWGNAYYFVDTHSPFPVSGPEVWGQTAWYICPVCGKEAPQNTKEKTGTTPNSAMVPCPTCGSACRVYSGDEGTNSFEPLFPYRAQHQ